MAKFFGDEGKTYANTIKLSRNDLWMGIKLKTAMAAADQAQSVDPHDLIHVFCDDQVCKSAIFVTDVTKKPYHLIRK
jgi:hypothetical protein